MKTSYIALFIVSAFIFFSQCKKDEKLTPVSGNIFVVNATSDTQWIYFSFEKNDTVKITDVKNSTDWDLAIRRFLIRTNSGLSGKGIAGADSTNTSGETGFEGYTSVANKATFAADVYMPVLAYMGMAKDTVNPVLYTWFSYNYATNQIVPSDKVYVLKTAKGKYAKLWIESYYNDASGTSGYVKLKYAYQSDGSMNLK